MLAIILLEKNFVFQKKWLLGQGPEKEDHFFPSRQKPFPWKKKFKVNFFPF